MSGNNWSVASYSAGEFSAQGQFAPADPAPSYSSPSFSQGQFSSVSGSEYSSPSFSGGTFSSVSEPTPQHHEVHHQHHQSHQEHHQSHQVHTQSHTQVHHESSRSVSTHDAFKPLDDDLDKIIAIATGLKGQVGGARGVINAELESREVQVKKVHGDLESLQQKLDSTSFANKEERSRLEQQISVKEAEQKAKLQEYDLKVQAELDARERAERERESARGDAAAEKARVGNLLKDLEEDASGYNRLRPSRPMLTEEDTVILRQLFLSSAVSGSGKFSFADLKQILAKYGNAIPEGPLKKLFAMVENDTKGRLSYITLVAVSNDLAALVGDFRKIDTNNNGTLSRKEFREHFIRLGFDKKSVQDSLFRYADEDESDDVGFSEYIHLSLCLLVLRILYAFADFDKSGHLSKEEVKRVLDDAQIPESARKKFEHQFSVVDVDDSKSLSYQEFVMLVLLMFHED